mgnify:CR=1 FL=1|jgi:DNA repair exonuclease SbcCD nuclease subunit
MRFVLINDIHGTARNPRGRIGDVLHDFEDKLRQLFELAKANDDAPIICGGDMFNSPRDILALFSFLRTRRLYKSRFFTVYGQHDMYYRNAGVINNIRILENANAIEVLGKKPKKFGEWRFYGCHWGESPKRLKNYRKTVLAAHAPIAYSGVFADHEYTPAGVYLKKNKFDLIVCGDIHRSFIHHTEKPMRWIVNTGPMMRLSTEEYILRHHPMAYIYDTKARDVQTFFFNVKPPEEVLNHKIKPSKEAVNTLSIDINTSGVDTINIYTVINKLLSESDNAKGIRKALGSISEEWR